MTESQQGLSLRSLRIFRAVGAVLVIVSVALIARYGLSFGRGLTFVSSFSVFATFALLVRDRRAPSNGSWCRWPARVAGWRPQPHRTSGSAGAADRERFQTHRNIDPAKHLDRNGPAATVDLEHLGARLASAVLISHHGPKVSN